MKLKDLLIEGMYDKLVGIINKDVFRMIKSAMNGSGSQDKPKKFKGYEVRKDPIPFSTVAHLFQSEDYHLEVGDYADKASGINIEVYLKFAVTEDGVDPGKFYIDGGVDDEDVISPSMEVQIAINPLDGVSILSKIQPVLRDLVRHEIEHLTHGRKSISLKPSKVMRGDKAMRDKIRDTPAIYYKYFLLPKEVDANIHGLYSKAKTVKQPYQKVVDDYLDSLTDDGIITTKNRDLIYKTWKARIPTIGGLPNLK